MSVLRWQPPTASLLRPRDIVQAVADARRLADDCIARLEVAYEQYFGAADVVLYDSGTSALAEAMRRTAGQSRCIAVPAYACPDLISAAEVADVQLVLYDVDPLTLQPDLASLQDALSHGAGTVVVVHFFGFPVDMTGIRALASSREVHVIEDAAQGAGGSWEGRPLGSWGDLGVISFGAGKGTTAGSGGMLVVNNAAFRDDTASLQPDALSAREVLRTLALWSLLRPGWFALPSALPFLGLGETHYRPGTRVRAMSRFAAALQSRRLAQVEPERVQRRRAWRELANGLQGAPGLRVLQPLQPEAAGYLRMPIRVTNGVSAASDRLGARLAYPRTLDQWGSDRVIARDHAIPGARTLIRELYTLPVHPRFSSSARQRLAATLGGRAAVTQ